MPYKSRGHPQITSADCLNLHHPLPKTPKNYIETSAQCFFVITDPTPSSIAITCFMDVPLIYVMVVRTSSYNNNNLLTAEFTLMFILFMNTTAYRIKVRKVNFGGKYIWATELWKISRCTELFMQVIWQSAAYRYPTQIAWMEKFSN